MLDRNPPCIITFMRTLIPILLTGFLASSCGQNKSEDARPADSQAATWLDGSQKDLREFLSTAQHRVINIGPKRAVNLLNVLYAGSPGGVYATMITEIDDVNAFAEQIIIKLPKDSAARESYVATVKQFFKDRGYPDETVGVDEGDRRFLIVDPNPGGSALTVGRDDDR